MNSSKEKSTDDSRQIQHAHHKKEIEYEVDRYVTTPFRFQLSILT